MRIARNLFVLLHFLAASLNWHEAAAQQQNNGEPHRNTLPDRRLVTIAIAVIAVPFNAVKALGLDSGPGPAEGLRFGGGYVSQSDRMWSFDQLRHVGRGVLSPGIATGLSDDPQRLEDLKGEADQLAEATIVTRSGQPATIFLGPSGVGATPDIRGDLAVQLMPLVISDGPILLNVQIERSKLPDPPAGGNLPPDLRSVNTTVPMQEGQILFLSDASPSPDFFDIGFVVEPPTVQQAGVYRTVLIFTVTTL